MKNCVLCEKPIDGQPKDDPVYFDGHNPWPITEKGRCCTRCNDAKVIPLRLYNHGKLNFIYTDDNIVPDMRFIDERKER